MVDVGVAISFRSPSDCAYDLVALGEVMLRLDPGSDRIRSAYEFRVHEGGGEYNVARALSSCFGLRCAIATSLVDNEVGHLLDGLIRRGGVDVSFCQWLPFDGVGRTARNPLNFTERGFGVRSALGVSDRGHSACSVLKPGDIDWEHLFGKLGVRCLHTGGIFTALSPSTAAVAEEAMLAARRHGTKVSYDLNYRPSLWQDAGGAHAAEDLNRRLLPLVDVVIGVPTANPERSDPTHGNPLERVIPDLREQYPNVACAAVTRRTVHSASNNDWSAIAWSKQTGLVAARDRKNIEIFDRVGGGDGFAAGFLFGLLEGYELRRALDYGTAHGALVMTTPGDTSSARLQDVRELAAAETNEFVR